MRSRRPLASFGKWFPDGERPLALVGDNEIAWVIADLACAQARIPLCPCAALL